VHIQNLKIKNQRLKILDINDNERNIKDNRNINDIKDIKINIQYHNIYNNKFQIFTAYILSYLGVEGKGRIRII